MNAAVSNTAEPATAIASISHPDRSTPRAYRVAERGVHEQQHCSPVTFCVNFLFGRHPSAEPRPQQLPGGQRQDQPDHQVENDWAERMPDPPEWAFAASHNGVSTTPSGCRPTGVR